MQIQYRLQLIVLSYEKAAHEWKDISDNLEIIYNKMYVYDSPDVLNLSVAQSTLTFSPVPP